MIDLKRILEYTYPENKYIFHKEILDSGGFKAFKKYKISVYIKGQYKDPIICKELVSKGTKEEGFDNVELEIIKDLINEGK